MLSKIVTWSLLLVLTRLLVTVYGKHVAPKDGTTKISIVTTAGSSDSAKFLSSKGFRETYSTFADFIEIQFLPVGQLQRLGKGGYVCRHGFFDYCEGNDYQRCTLDLLDDDSVEQVNYMMCVYELKPEQFHLNPKQHLNRCLTCAEASGVHQRDVLDCVASPLAAKLAQDVEYEAALIIAQIKYAPAIVFDDYVEKKLNKLAYEDFPYTVCRVFLRNGVDRCNFGTRLIK